MSLSKFLQNTGLAALAAALVVTALPTEASAQDRRNRSERAAGEARQDSGARARPNNAFEARARQVQPRQQQRAARIDNRTDQRAARIDNRSEQRAARVERQGDRAAQQAARRGNPGQARQIDRRSEQVARQIERRGDARANQVERRGDWRANQVQQQRNRTYIDPNRNRGNNNANWANGRRDNDRNGYQNRRRDNDRWSDNNRGNDRRWDRRWRDNNRYDWQRYRSRNRVVFNVGVYYAPYRNYSYRRYGIGGRLDSLLYSSSYWINDPYQYRLPEVYGPYRWVRYYDDVLLVDIYSGQVVDVIHDFFW